MTYAAPRRLWPVRPGYGLRLQKCRMMSEVAQADFMGAAVSRSPMRVRKCGYSLATAAAFCSQTRLVIL